MFFSFVVVVFFTQKLQLFHSGAWCDGAHGPGTFIFPWITFDISILVIRLSCDRVRLSGKVSDSS